MPYLVNRYDSSAPDAIFPVYVPDETVVSEFTDIAFTGKFKTQYSKAINENFVYLCEHFKSPVEPPNKITGQIWFSSTDNVLRFWDGVQWRIVGTYVNNVQPGTANIGDLWFDGNTLYAWNGTTWIKIGPNGDSNNYNSFENINGVDILRIVIAGQTVGIFSSGNIPFSALQNNPVPLNDQDNFPDGIDFGINISLIGSLGTTYKFNGIDLVTNPKTVTFSGTGFSTNVTGKDLDLTVNAGNNTGSSGVSLLHIKTLAVSGIYTVPDGITKIFIKIYGAPGGGANDDDTANGTQGGTTIFTGTGVNMTVTGGAGAQGGLNGGGKPLISGNLSGQGFGGDLNLLGHGQKGGVGVIGGSSQPDLGGIASTGGDGGYSEKLITVYPGDIFNLSLGTGGFNPALGTNEPNAIAQIYEYGPDNPSEIDTDQKIVVYDAPGTYTFTVPDNVFQIKAQLWGPGGCGTFGGFPRVGNSGGSGAYGLKYLDVNPGQNLTIIVGGGMVETAGLAPQSTSIDGTYVAGGGQPLYFFGDTGSAGLASNNFDFSINGQHGSTSNGAGDTPGPGGSAPLGGGGDVYGGYGSVAPGGAGRGGLVGQFSTDGAHGRVILEYKVPRFLSTEFANIAFGSQYTNNGSNPMAFNGNDGGVFPTTEYNIGGGYNNTTGYFTVPKNGIYQFNAYIQYKFNPGVITNYGAIAYLLKISNGSTIFLAKANRLVNNPPSLISFDMPVAATCACLAGDQITLVVTNDIAHLSEGRFDGYYVQDITVTTQSQIYDVPGNYTWTVPDNIYNASVELYGAGGGCAGINGGSGGSGAYTKKSISVFPGDTHNITVGTGGFSSEWPGGPGGGPGSSPAGTGGTTLFDSLFQAGGGGGATAGPGGSGIASGGDININGNIGQDLSPSITSSIGAPGVGPLAAAPGSGIGGNIPGANDGNIGGSGGGGNGDGSAGYGGSGYAKISWTIITT